MGIVLLGPPGSGKGTQCHLLEQRLAIPHVSTGDMLRSSVDSQSILSKQARAHMDRGELVPDDVMIGIVEERLGQSDCHDGFLLDGFPRTVEQVRALRNILKTTDTKIAVAISLEVPREELIRRLSGRRTCNECGRMYHVELSPPKIEGKCDQCGNDLCQRKDDHEDTISARLEVYRRQTAPILEFFRNAGLLRDVNGLGDSEQVHERIIEVLSPMELK